MPEGELLAGTQRALLRRLATEQADQRIPSIVAVLVRDGRVLWTGIRGRVDGAPPTERTQYRIGSITKSFAAVVVMRLRDEGRLDLSDPIGTHVPGVPHGERTVAQLLAHTSGLTAEPPGEWWERTPGADWAAFRSAIGPDAARHRAGRRFHYSNLGYGVLGELVARLRGVSWADAVRREILEPLGMRDTTPAPRPPHAAGWAVHPWADVLLPEPAHDAGAMAPAGQLWSTAADLSRWAAFVTGDTGEVLHPDTLAEMREPAGVDDGDEWSGGYGLGLQLLRNKGRRLAGHSGSMPGFLAIVWGNPEDRTGVLYLANTTSGTSGTLATDLLDILDEYEPKIPDEWSPDDGFDPALLELTGPWYWGPAPYLLRLRPDRFLDIAPMSGRRGRASRFRPEPDGTWTGLDGYHAGETLRVVRGPDGTVSHLNLATFIFTRTVYDPDAPIPGGLDPKGWRANESAG